MSFTDWLAETAHRFQNGPPTTAAQESAHALRLGVQRRLGPFIGTPVWERDWDLLVVLDACRVDQMQAVTTEYERLPSRVERTWSTASCSIDWIDRTFNDHPTNTQTAGYVTANPFADHDSPDTRSADLSQSDLALFIPLYKTHWEDISPNKAATARYSKTGRAGVGSGIATVPPEPVTDHGIDAWRKRQVLGMDRLILHYMQPHEPYRSHPEWGSDDSKLLENLVDETADAGSSVWPEAKRGAVSIDDLWEAGVDNLRWVLDDVCGRLLNNVDADIVITADHGNAMGEWGEWHHPPGALSPAVRTVPWIEVAGTDSGTVTPGVDVSKTGVQTEYDAETQLEHLGYR